MKALKCILITESGLYEGLGVYKERRLKVVHVATITLSIILVIHHTFSTSSSIKFWMYYSIHNFFTLKIDKFDKILSIHHEKILYQQLNQQLEILYMLRVHMAPPEVLSTHTKLFT